MGKNTEELNFLRGELKKINDQIAELQYNTGVLEYQVKLWELKNKIEGKIRYCESKEENQ